MPAPKIDTLEDAQRALDALYDARGEPEWVKVGEARTDGYVINALNVSVDPTKYRALKVVGRIRSSRAGVIETGAILRVNGDSGSKYNGRYDKIQFAGTWEAQALYGPNPYTAIFLGDVPAATNFADVDAYLNFECVFPDARDGGVAKHFSSVAQGRTSGHGGMEVLHSQGWIQPMGSISSVQLLDDAGSMLGSKTYLQLFGRA